MDGRLGVLLAVVAGLTGFGPPGAGAPRATTCRFEAEFAIDPGLRLVPTSGTFTSGGERGRLTCDGPVDGHRPTGTGTFGAAGHYGVDGPDSCATGEGAALQSFTVPTAAGPHRFRNDARFTWRTQPGYSGDPDTPVILARGEFSGPKLSGSLEILPLDGDCVTSPATRVLVRLWAEVKGAG